MVKRDGLPIRLSLMEGNRGGSNRIWREKRIDAYIWVKGIGSLYAECVASGAYVVEAPTTHVYGTKELTVRDLDGYHIVFGENVPQPAGSGESD
jgi:hypothetical protein